MKPTGCDVGGQAILEGVMMRSPNSLAIAVRKPSGEIVVKEDRWVSIWKRVTFLRWPFLRGAVVFVSGQTAKTDPDDFEVKTPLATIGVRGTIVGANLGEAQLVGGDVNFTGA